MALPTYDKTKRRKNFEQLPKNAYVIKIIGAKEEPNKNSSGTHLSIGFDIAEGEYKDFYQRQFDANTAEDKKWPADAMFYLTVPGDNAEDWVVTNWNTFFADLEDSNNGFVFGGSLPTLKGKLLGGKFRIEQTEYNGNVYDHTKLRFTCVADDVRNGKAGKLPKDKLIEEKKGISAMPENEWMNVPDGEENEVPF